MTAKATPDVLGLCMGLTSWVFPDIHIAIKVGLTLVVIIIVIFLKMDKDKQTNALHAMAKFIDNYLMPGLGGGIRALFFTLIGIIIADAVFNIHLIDHGNYYNQFSNYGSAQAPGFAGIILHSLGNLTSAGNIILGIAVFLGAASRISHMPKEKK